MSKTSCLIDGLTVDRRLDLRPGTADRLAKRGTLPHVKLPHGLIRFRWSQVAQCLQIINGPSTEGKDGRNLNRLESRPVGKGVRNDA